MNIYIFVPYKWDYCGGAIAILAHTTKEAIEVIKENPRYAEHTFYLEEQEDVSDYDNWILDLEMMVNTSNIPPMVVMDNWNYS